MSIFKTTMGLVLAVVLTACGGGGGDASAPAKTTTPTTTSTATIASLLLTAPSPQTINADGTAFITMTVRALDASNALVKGAVIALTANSNAILSASSVTTDATTGIATVTLTAIPSDPSTRVSTVTASCAACAASAATLSIQINGATLSVTSSGGTALTAGGNSVNVNAVVKDASGIPMLGKTVTFASTDPTILGLGATTATTNASGVATATVSGLTAGSASINVSSLGNAQSLAFTVTATVGALAITSPTNNSAMVTNVAKTISVSAPNATQISFFSTVGTFSAPIYSGVAGAANFAGSADLTVAQGGIAAVTIGDDLLRSANLSLTVSPPVSLANKVILSASQTTVGLANSTNTPSIRLTAQAQYSSGGNAQGVANVPILFTMSGGPNGGEYLTPAYVLTDSSGKAFADFYSGTSASTQPVVVSAQIQGNVTAAGTARSNITIGGAALSVAFGPASVIRESTDKTLYIQDYSVQVTDAGGNAVDKALVTLRVRPVAFSLGSGCAISKDATVPTANATYCSEDANGNGSLDSGEDGVRKLTTVSTAGKCASLVAGAAASTSDTLLTPQNSVAGAVPATVTTDATGTAPFSLTYLKASAIWVVDKLSATVSVNGTESGSETIFQLPASVVDVKLPDTCNIPNSPFSY